MFSSAQNFKKGGWNCYLYIVRYNGEIENNLLCTHTIGCTIVLATPKCIYMPESRNNIALNWPPLRWPCPWLATPQKIQSPELATPKLYQICGLCRFLGLQVLDLFILEAEQFKAESAKLCFIEKGWGSNWTTSCFTQNDSIWALR